LLKIVRNIAHISGANILTASNIDQTPQRVLSMCIQNGIKNALANKYAIMA